jgi:hypothetical protein
MDDETWDPSQGIASFRWWYTPDDVAGAHARVKATLARRGRDPGTGAPVVRSALLVEDALVVQGPVHLDALVQFADGTVSEVELHAQPAADTAPRAQPLMAAALRLLQRLGATGVERAVAAGRGEWTLSGAQVVLELEVAALRLTVRRPVASRP